VEEPDRPVGELDGTVGELDGTVKELDGTVKELDGTVGERRRGGRGRGSTVAGAEVARFS
jgi:hypothetical protein